MLFIQILPQREEVFFPVMYTRSFSRHQEDMGKAFDTKGFQEIRSCLHGPIIASNKIQDVNKNYLTDTMARFRFDQQRYLANSFTLPKLKISS